MAVANARSNTIAILMGNGDATFDPARHVAVGLGPTAIAVGDFNADKIPDLVVANLRSNNLTILLGNGDATFQPGRNIERATSRSVVVGDFNGDEIQDLALPGSYYTRILLGNGNGTFQALELFWTGEGGGAGTAGDFNGDNILDLAVANGDPGAPSVSIQLGIGDGTFRPQQRIVLGFSPVAFMVGDFNGDGLQDLAVACSSSNLVAILLGNGDGTFQGAQTLRPGRSSGAVAVGDLDGDGVPDLVVNNGSILLGNGDGTFRIARQYDIFGTSLALADFNGDKILDLVLVNENDGHRFILLGNGDGTFGEARAFAAGGGPTSIAVGDFNGDALLDLAVAYSAPNPGTVSILLGNGDGTFQADQAFVVGYSPRSITVGDFNGDRIPDLAVANLLASNVSILLGNGDGTFRRYEQEFGVGIFAYSIAVGDFNGDTWPDLVVANAGSYGRPGTTVSVLINDPAVQPTNQIGNQARVP